MVACHATHSPSAQLAVAELSAFAQSTLGEAATRAARGGTGVNALMGLGGWTSTATAMRYVNKQRIANDGVKFEDSLNHNRLIRRTTSPEQNPPVNWRVYFFTQQVARKRNLIDCETSFDK